MFKILAFQFTSFIYFWGDDCPSNVPPGKSTGLSFSGHFSYFPIVFDFQSFTLLEFFSGFVLLPVSLPVWKIVNNAPLYTMSIPPSYFYFSGRNLITCTIELVTPFFSLMFSTIFFHPFLSICLHVGIFSESLSIHCLIL